MDNGMLPPKRTLRLQNQVELSKICDLLKNVVLEQIDENNKYNDEEEDEP